MAPSAVETPANRTIAQLAETVRGATAAKRPLRIVGADTKAFYGRRTQGEPLSLAAHAGVVAYDPSELVIMARAGTPLGDLEARLKAHGQRLAFEPPRFGPSSTIGGVVAAGLSGPRRSFAGAVRDSVLGATIMDGRGQVLRFGGQVFKNVAGFDAFRLMAGALGALGVILEVTLRVVPFPRRETSLTLEMESERARGWICERMRSPIPLSGAFHDGARLWLRLSGGEASVAAAAREIGGEVAPLTFWDDLRDFRLPVFEGPRRLWRLSLPQTATIPPVGEVAGWDWAGAQVWVCSDLPSSDIWRAAAEAGGHATLFRGAAAGEEVFQPLSPPLLELHRRLKAALDPAGVFNPGRLYGAF